MKKALFLGLVLLALITALACGSNSVSEATSKETNTGTIAIPAEAEGNQEVRFKVDLTGFEDSSRNKALGLIASVTKVTATVRMGEYVATGELTKVIGYISLWEGTIIGIPLHESLTMDIEAFNAANVKIFSGTDSFIVDSTEVLDRTIQILPIDDGTGQTEAPTIDRISISSSQIAPGSNVQFTATVSDPDTTSDNLVYLWTSANGTFSSPNQDSSVWTSPNEIGTYPVRFEVSDTDNYRSINFNVEVDHYGSVNAQVIIPPVIQGFDGEWSENTFTLRPRIDYPGSVTYSWNQNGEEVGSSGNIAITATSGVFTHDISLSVRPSDDPTVVVTAVYDLSNEVQPEIFIADFFDDFNDGDLEGWIMKSGTWNNPSDHMLSSVHNYGIIWKENSFGHTQSINIDATYLEGQVSKSAQIRLRSGDAGSGSNPFFDHGYVAVVMTNTVIIQNCVQPSMQITLAQKEVSLETNTSHNIDFSVSGTGTNTHLILKINGTVYLDTYDTSGYAHDDGGVLALGSSNHINTTIVYDNFVGISKLLVD